ncbi:MAG: hypothetical protein JO297_04680 [Nitrososphaeraceae archaeon]|nr:hypothetical protein [Nitrososphaeraceae archaeon]
MEIVVNIDTDTKLSVLVEKGRRKERNNEENDVANVLKYANELPDLHKSWI